MRPHAIRHGARRSISAARLGEGGTATTAVSRGARPHDLQDALRAEAAAQVACAMRLGARVTVCGGRDMAQGVAPALGDILGPVGLTPAMVKAGGRYVEDLC